MSEITPTPTAEEGIERFGPFEVDRACYELRRNGSRIPIQGRPLSLLIYLMDRRHRVVSKEEIHEQVWSGVIVCESTMASAIRDLRRALDDDGREQKVIRTVHGVGYRFVASLEPSGRATPAPTPRSAEAPSRESWAPRRERGPLRLEYADGAEAPPVARAPEAVWLEGFQQRLLGFLARELAAAPSDVRVRDLVLPGLAAQALFEANGTAAAVRN